MRGALEATDHVAACERAFAADGRRMSRQALAILSRVREVDTLLRADPDARERTWEVHPELCFGEWNRGAPMADAKRSAAGLAQRLALAERDFPGAYASTTTCTACACS